MDGRGEDQFTCEKIGTKAILVRHYSRKARKQEARSALEKKEMKRTEYAKKI